MAITERLSSISVGKNEQHKSSHTNDKSAN